MLSIFITTSHCSSVGFPCDKRLTDLVVTKPHRTTEQRGVPVYAPTFAGNAIKINKVSQYNKSADCCKHCSGNLMFHLILQTKFNSNEDQFSTSRSADTYQYLLHSMNGAKTKFIQCYLIYLSHKTKDYKTKEILFCFMEKISGPTDKLLNQLSISVSSRYFLLIKLVTDTLLCISGWGIASMFN